MRKMKKIKSKKKTKKLEKKVGKNDKRAHRGVPFNTPRDGHKNCFFTKELSIEIVTKLKPKKIRF